MHDPIRREWATGGTFPATGDRCRVRVLLDGSVAEVYLEHGPTFTERVAAPAPTLLALTGEAGRGEGAVRALGRP